LSVHITHLSEEKQAFLTLFCQIRLLKDHFQQVWLRLQAKNKDVKLMLNILKRINKI